jgi:hypothetical protein
MDNSHRLVNQTVPGIGPGKWDSGKLAREQELKAVGIAAQRQSCLNMLSDAAVLYRLYTEDVHRPKLLTLISRYFSGATLFYGSGLWMDTVEAGTVIEIVATAADLQPIIHLAGDIKVQNHQSSVLVTWAPVSRLDV